MVIPADESAVLAFLAVPPAAAATSAARLAPANGAAWPQTESAATTTCWRRHPTSLQSDFWHPHAVSAANPATAATSSLLLILCAAQLKHVTWCQAMEENSSSLCKPTRGAPTRTQSGRRTAQSGSVSPHCRRTNAKTLRGSAHTPGARRPAPCAMLVPHILHADRPERAASKLNAPIIETPAHTTLTTTLRELDPREPCALWR